MQMEHRTPARKVVASSIGAAIAGNVMKHRISLSLTFIALSACATPDVSTELNDTIKSFDALVSETRPALAKKSVLEIEAAEEALIQQRKSVVLTTGVCLPIGALSTLSDDTIPDPCGLESLVDVTSGPANASQVIALETAMDLYLKSLMGLTDSTSIAEAKTNVGALIVAIDGLATKQQSKSLTKLAAVSTKNKDRATNAVGFLLNQYRHQALKKAVGKGEKVIQSASATLFYYYQNNNPAVSKATSDLVVKEKAMLKARTKGTIPEYRASIAALRKSHEDLVAAQKADPAIWYATFAKSHTALHKRLQSGGDISDFIVAIDELISLKPK